MIRAIKDAWARWRHPLMCSVVRFEVLAYRISRLDRPFRIGDIIRVWPLGAPASMASPPLLVLTVDPIRFVFRRARCYEVLDQRILRLWRGAFPQHGAPEVQI